jgi:hypothetical protein
MDPDLSARPHDPAGSQTLRRIDVPSPSARTRWQAALVWTEADAGELMIVASLSALFLLVHLLRLEGIANGGDAIQKWHFVRQWFYKNDFSQAKWDHHMARMGANLPAYLVQLLFGRGPRSYYIAPLAAGTAQVVLVYATARRLGGRLAGVFCALLLVYFEPTVSYSSQLLTEVFSGAYTICAAYLYVRYADARESERSRWLVGVSLALFFAYLAKETNLFFFPGFVLALWMARRRLRDVALLCGLLFGGFLMETVVYNFVSPYSHRFAIITGSTGATETLNSFWQLFDRYVELDEAWKFAFYFFLASSIGLLALTRNPRIHGLLAIVASFYLFLTFLVRGIHPINIWHRFIPRYLDPTAPLVQLLNALFVTRTLREAWRRLRGDHWPHRFSPLARFGPVATLALVVILSWSSYQDTRNSLATHPFRVNAQMADVATDAYLRNLPLVFRRPPSRTFDYPGSLDVVYSVLLDDKLLARNGVLPKFEEAKRVQGPRTFLVRNPSAYDQDGGKLARMIRSHCFIEVRDRRLFMQLRPMSKLSPECDAVR